MNVDDKEIEPATDLGLSLGYSHQHIQRISNNDAGAGANAVSRTDMTFVATDSLSELIWSPQKGLSLKCADGSFSDKKTSLIWGVGASNIKSGSSSDEPINEENFATSMANEVSGRENSNRFLTSDKGMMPLNMSTHELTTAPSDRAEEVKDTVGVSFVKVKEDLRNNKGGVCDPISLQMAEISEMREIKFSVLPDEPEMDVAQHYPTYEENKVRAEDGERNLISGMEIVLASEVHSVKEFEVNDDKMQYLRSFDKSLGESPQFSENETKNKMDSCPEKLESTDENDLRTENACGVASQIETSESVHEAKDNTLKDDERLARDMTVASKQSPTVSRIQRYQMKGKAKALSDGNVDGNMLNDDDDSHESVESCNSAGLFSNGKKRWNVEQQLVVANKQIRRQYQDCPGSSSFVKRDSSFMNWISNMMKGFSKSNKDEVPSLSLTLANANHGRESSDQKHITCNRSPDHRCKATGFQSIFQSLYGHKTKTQETVNFNSNYHTEQSKELELSDKVCDSNATPIACRTVTGNIYKRFLPSKEKFNDPVSASEAGPEAQPKNISINLAASEEINRSNSVEDKPWCDLRTDKAKDGTSPNSSQSKCKTNSTENIDSELPSRGKSTDNLGYKSDPLGSLWITRFTPKTCGPLASKDLCKTSTGETLDFATDGMRLKSSLQILVGSDDHKVVENRDDPSKNPLHMLNSSTGTDISFAFYKTRGHHDEKSIFKLRPTLPSSRLKNSEAMASIFARRLDAFKHIMPSGLKDTAARANMTCFFCGIKGHHLQDCSEITDTELKSLLRNVNAYSGAEEFPFVCIRCFQLNHWAIQCPNASSGVRDQTEFSASLVSKHGPSKTLLNAKYDDNPKLCDARNNQFQAVSASLICDRNGPKMENDHNSDLKLNEASPSGRQRLSMKQFQKGNASSSRENKMEENPIRPLCNLLNMQTSNMPNGISDSVKRLRLSRADILRWINSQMPLSHLDGFFLRLRLGKWEEGLGGTGYYVACITGVQAESPLKRSKNSIPVNVGGIKCLVESQYVSNHEFLEDEIVAWWSAASKGGDKIPSEEDLKLKLNEKKMLGL